MNFNLILFLLICSLSLLIANFIKYVLKNNFLYIKRLFVALITSLLYFIILIPYIV